MGQMDDVVPPSPTRSALAEVARRWVLVTAIALVALTASLVGTRDRTPSYSVTAKLIITPLPQWDETFLGTSLVRDAGDPNRTAATAAEVVESPEVAREAAARLGGGATVRSVREAVEVKPVPDTNVLAVTAVAGDPARARRLADAFATSVLTVRWRRIQRELDDRIALTAAIPSPGDGDEAAQASETLKIIRSAGKDPTMTLERSGPAVKVRELPTVAIAALASAGGVFVGGLVAVAMGRMTEGPRPETSPGAE